MKITEVRVIVTCPGRNYVLVKLITDQPGLYGVGDASLNGRELAVAAALEQHIAPLLIGRDPDRIEDRWQSLFRGSYFRQGPVLMTALAGVDTALWDIKGKWANLPVYSLLGGKTREGVLAYSHAGGRDPQEVAASVHQLRERGFKVIRAQVAVPAPGITGTYGIGAAERKLTTGMSSTEPDPTMPDEEVWEPGPYLRAIPKLFEHLRVEFGDDLELFHDVHERLSPIQAARLARELEPYHLFFLEDPLRPEHKESFRLVRHASTTPIAMGELWTDKWACLTAITEQLIDYIRCDLAHTGGITECRKIASIAEPYQVRTAWHGPGDISPHTHAANVHLDFATSNFGVQEMVFFSEQQQEVMPGGPTFEDGYLQVRDVPGLGTDVDEHAAAKYPYQRAYLPPTRRVDGSVHDW